MHVGQVLPPLSARILVKNEPKLLSNENSLAERLNFIGIDPPLMARLKGLKPAVMAALPAALDIFYEKIRGQPETAAFFSDSHVMDHARARQNAHWDMISDGDFDDVYLAAATKIGEVHAKIGVAPRWYIAGYALIVEQLTAAVLKERWPKARFWQRKSDSGAAARDIAAITKAAFLDMDLVISIYLARQEAALKTVEAQKDASSEMVTAALGNALSALASGDLTHKINNDMPPEYDRLREDYHAAMLTLQGTLISISSSAGAVSSGAGEITQASDDLSRRTEQQAASLEETAAALDQITTTVRKTAESSAQARKLAEEASAKAEHSGDVVHQAVAAMNGIEKSSNEIGNIIGVIDEIAFQTNLLALNAGIEAARAGDAGRGFAVVATEVRALAQRSATAAKEIKALISASGGQVTTGVGLVGETGVALGLIVEQVAQLNTLILEIAASAQEQASGLHQVNIAVNQMDRVTQQNAAMVEQATAASHSLATEANELTRLTGKFKVGGGEASPAALPHKAALMPRQSAKPAGKVLSMAGAPKPQLAIAGAEDQWKEF